MMKLIIALCCLLLLSSPTYAARKVISADISENFVGVNEGFDGAKLTLFGVLKKKTDAVIVIEGPAAMAKVRPKIKQAGIWINGEPQEIGPVPSFYAVLSSRPIEDIVSQETATQNGWILDKLPVTQTEIGAGYVQVKQKQGLFQYKSDGITIRGSNLFRADNMLPSSVPIGVFTARIFEIEKGNITATQTETFRVAQVGMNATLSRLSRDHTLLYSLMALTLSLGLATSSAYLLRRRS